MLRGSHGDQVLPGFDTEEILADFLDLAQVLLDVGQRDAAKAVVGAQLDDEHVLDYDVSPDGRRVAVVAHEAKSKQRKKLEEQGYSEEIFEEDWRPRLVYVARLETDLPDTKDPSIETDTHDDESQEPTELKLDGSVSGVEWLPAGNAPSSWPAPASGSRRSISRPPECCATEVGARLSWSPRCWR